MEQQTGSKLRKEYYNKAVYCHFVYLTSMQSTLCEMPCWMNHKLESRLLGEISIMSDMQITPPSSLLMEVKKEHEKASLKLYTQKTKIMDSGLTANRRGKSGSSDIYFLGLQNHLDNDCSHKIKRYLLLGRKAKTNLDNVLKSRDTTLPTKVLSIA